MSRADRNASARCLAGTGLGLLCWLAMGRLSGAWILGPEIGAAACLAGIVLVAPATCYRIFPSRRPQPLSGPEKAVRAGAWIGIALAFGFALGWIPGLLPDRIEALAGIVLLFSVAMLLLIGRLDHSWPADGPLRWSGAAGYGALSFATGGIACGPVLHWAGRLSGSSAATILSAMALAWSVRMIGQGLHERHAETHAGEPAPRYRHGIPILSAFLPAALWLALLWVAPDATMTLLMLALASAMAGFWLDCRSRLAWEGR